MRKLILFLILLILPFTLYANTPTPTKTIRLAVLKTPTPTYTKTTRMTKTVTPTCTLTVTATNTPVYLSTFTPTITPTAVIGYVISNKNLLNTEQWGTVTIVSDVGVSLNIARGFDFTSVSLNWSFINRPANAINVTMTVDGDIFYFNVLDSSEVAVDCSVTNCIIDYEVIKL